MINNPYLKYKTVSLTTTSETQQLLYIFDEILKLLHVARKSLEDQEIEKKYFSLKKAQEILISLKLGIVDNDEISILKYFDNFLSSAIIKINQLNISAEDPEEITKFIDIIKSVRDTIFETSSNTD